MPKQLYQMDWSGGQTDGDQMQNNVKQLLNVEIDDPGRIRTRDSLTAGSVLSFPPGNCAYMTHNPTVLDEYSDATGWLAFVTATGVALYQQVGSTFSGSPVHMDCGLDNVDDKLSEISVYGDKVFLAAVDSDGNPLGAFMIFSPSSSGRFLAPHEVAGTEWDGSSAAEPHGWDIQSLDLDTPIASSVSVTPTFQMRYHGIYINSNGDNMGEIGSATNIPIRDIFEQKTAELRSRMSANGSLSVGVIGYFSYADDDYNYTDMSAKRGLYGVDAEIEIKVQYVFYGDQVSKLSNGTRLSAGNGIESGLLEKEFSFGITVVVPENISPSVKGINVYRKIISSGNPDLASTDQFELLATMWLDSDLLSDDSEQIGSASFETYLDGDGSRSQQGLEGRFPIPDVLDVLDGDYLLGYYSGWASTNDWWASMGVGYVSSSVRVDGDFWKTSGWVKAWGGFYVYCNLHYGGPGFLRFSLDCVVDPPTTTFTALGYQYKNSWVRYSCTLASTRYGSSSNIQTTMLRLGADAPMGMISRDSDGFITGYTIAVPTAPPADGHLSLDYNSFSGYGCRVHPDCIAAFTIDGIDGGAPESGVKPFTGGPAQSIDFPEGYAKSDFPLIMIRDNGETPADSEYSFNGLVSEDLVVNKPKHMAIAGGRFIGLGGNFSGSEMPTRAWYSQYQKFNMFGKESYIDYGARDDGVGVGLSAFKGTAILHFTAATYLIDMSGGFDMSWRELGAYTGIGLLHSRALCETPLGVFWGDKNDIYWFDGKRVLNISHIDSAKRTVRDSYREFVAAGSDLIRFNYRSDLRQVWVSAGRDVLVLDADRAAWHKHYLEELDDGVAITAMPFANGTQMAVASDGTSSTVYRLDPDGLVGFDWGVTFKYDAGAPEVVKKAKRFYVDVTGTGSFRTEVIGDGVSSIVQFIECNNAMQRFSASVRGRAVRLDLKTTEDDRWRGVIESLGMSHKVKNLK